MYFPSDAFSKAAQRAGKGVDAPADEKGHTLLQLAIRNGDTVAAERLINLGANPKQLDVDGHTPVFDAMAAGNARVLALLLQKGGSFRAEDDDGRTPLMWAIQNNASIAFLEEARQLGLPFDQVNKKGRGAIHAAAAADRVDFLDYLLRSRVYVDTVDNDGKSPLHIAVEAGAYDAMKYLIDTGGADVTLRTKDIKTPLYLAAAKGDMTAVEMLLAVSEARRTLNEYRTYEKGYSPLMAAVAENRYEAVATLIAHGADVNQQDSSNRHSLFIAVEKGYPALVDLLIRSGADVEKGPRALGTEQTMVHLIAKNAYKEILPQLYSAGANLNAVDGAGQTALFKASESRDLEKINLLLDYGADPNFANKAGKRPIDALLTNSSWTNVSMKEAVLALIARGADVNLAPSPSVQSAPLHIAARSNYPDLVNVLLDNGAIIDQPERVTGATAWLLAVGAGKSLLAKQLEKRGADVMKRDSKDHSVLHMAAQGGADDILKAFLADERFKAAIDARDAEGRTPLHIATRLQKNSAAELLLDKGANPLAVDHEGKTPLHYAAMNYSDSIFSSFERALGRKANWNVQSADEKETPLHIAAKNGYNTIVERLLRLDASLVLKDARGFTPLMAAINAEQVASVRQILGRMSLKKAAVDSQRDDAGRTPLHIAVSRWNVVLADALLDAGADINARTPEGDTPLHVAAALGRADITRFLLRKNADVLAANTLGATPLDLAVENGNNEIAGLLAKAMAERQPSKSPRQPPKPPLRPAGPRP